MKGAPEKVLQQCTSYYSHGSVVPLVAKDLETFNDAVAAMSSKGLRGTIRTNRLFILLKRDQELSKFEVFLYFLLTLAVLW